MANVSIAILSLLIAALVLAIVELGLSAYLVSVATRTYSYNTYDAYTGYTDGAVSYHGQSPGQLSFLLFCSLWTTVIVGARFLLPLIRGRDRQGNWVGPVTLTVNAVTMIFWLAGFAALETLYGGYSFPGILGALLAFAVLPWLVFLALLVLNILTAFGVVESDQPGYPAMFGSKAGHFGGGEKTNEAGAASEMQRPVAEV